ncbi:unnamed protein product [Gulo gulo]|uniref:Uncharacterized protein n=1 Tax=Gulo gulo TaxID=48420 RepID=A0A9X9MBL5_GULGU|nr:unnamed protein product [Gulo gulo]
MIDAFGDCPLAMVQDPLGHARLLYGKQNKTKYHICLVTHTEPIMLPEIHLNTTLNCFSSRVFPPTPGMRMLLT